jgi:flagellar motor component MotA
MEKALRAWLDAHGLFGITAAVLGVIATLSVLIVGAFYLLATP